MDGQLLYLIIQCENDTARAVGIFLTRANLAHPLSWRDNNMPRLGRLEGDPPIRYAFHGAGLRLRIGAEMIDFDFGFDGRTGGFNEYWLGEYAEHRLWRFPAYEHRVWLRRSLDAARESGEVARLFAAHQDDLYYRVARFQ